jgi:L-cysteine/cystine lyase
LARVEAPVLLDGAQGVGAVPVDVEALGCDAYAGSGQKWLCGPDGTGMLYVSSALQERLAVTSRHHNCFEDAGAGLDARLHDDARRFDAPALPAEASAFAVASLEVLEEAGWETVHARAREAAARLAAELERAGRAVMPRGETTLVSWSCDEAEAARDRLAARGVVVRDLPGRGLLRASVGAWNDESDLQRLLHGLE